MTLFYERSEGGLGRTGKRRLAESAFLLLFCVNVVTYVEEEYLFCGCALAMLRYKSGSDGKYVKKSLHLRFGEL